MTVSHPPAHLHDGVEVARIAEVDEADRRRPVEDPGQAGELLPPAQGGEGGLVHLAVVGVSVGSSAVRSAG